MADESKSTSTSKSNELAIGATIDLSITGFNFIVQGGRKDDKKKYCF